MYITTDICLPHQDARIIPEEVLEKKMFKNSVKRLGV
jgi:hypothetical protein